MAPAVQRIDRGVLYVEYDPNTGTLGNALQTYLKKFNLKNQQKADCLMI